MLGIFGMIYAVASALLLVLGVFVGPFDVRLSAASGAAALSALALLRARQWIEREMVR